MRVQASPARIGVIAAATAGCWLAAAGLSAASGPVPVAPRTIDASPVALAFDGQGHAVASWRGMTGASPDVATYYASLARRSPQGDWSPAPLAGEVFGHDVAVSPAGRVALAVWRQQPRPGDRSRSSIELMVGRASTLAFARTIRLALGPALAVTPEGHAPALALPKVAIARDGEIVVAWQRTMPRSAAGVWVAVRRPSGRMIRPRLIGPGGGEPQLALAGDGAGVVAWQRGSRLLARRRDASGRWSPVEVAYRAPREQWAALESLRVTAARRIPVAATIVTVRSAAGVKVRVNVHARVPGSRWRTATLGVYRFRATALTSHAVMQLRALPLFTGDGVPRVVFPMLRDSHVGAAVTQLFPERDGVGTGTTTFLSAPDADVAIDDAATGEDGRYAFTWFSVTAGRGSTNLAEGDAGGTFTVSSVPASEPALLGSQVAYDPLTGRPLVVSAQGAAPAGFQPMAWSP